MNPLRLAVGLLRFAVALSGAAIRLMVGSAGEPDPIDLEPRVLQRSGTDGDGSGGRP